MPRGKGTSRPIRRGGTLLLLLAWCDMSAAADPAATADLIDAALGSAAIALLGSLMMLATLTACSKRDEMAATWLALTCGWLSAALLFATHPVARLLPGFEALSTQQLGGLTATALTWALGTLAIKHRRMFGTLQRRELRGLLMSTAAVSLLAALLFPVVAPLLTGWWILVGAWGLFPALRAAMARRRSAAPTVLAAGLLMMGIGIDLSTFLTSGKGSSLAIAAMAGFAFIHAAILVRQFIRGQRLAARLSANLAQEVELRTRELQRKNDTLEDAQKALQRANEALQQISITDGLTQIHNRMYFEQRLEQEWRRCSRQGTQLSVLMIDADNFKQVNDTAGHLAGDRCLQAISAELSRQFRRAGELVARYGGEEFVVLLPEKGHSAAVAIAEGVRAAIANLALSPAGGIPIVTVSIGVSTTVPTGDQAPQQLLGAADDALYEAKGSGRNRVHSLPLIGGRSHLRAQGAGS